MRPHYALSFLALLASAGLSAQQVQKCCGTSNSTFLLGNLTLASHIQSLYLPGDLTGAQDGDITQLYFRYGSTGEDLGNTLGGFMIRMGLTNLTAFQSGNLFFTDLDTVLMVTEQVIAAGVEGEWFTIPLAVPFPYQMGRTLILDVWYATSATTNFGTLGTTNNGRKLYANSLTSPTGTTTSTTWQDLGFDLSAPTGVAPMEATAPRLLPLPGEARWMLTWGDADTQAGQLELLDASGRLLRTEAVRNGAAGHVLDLADAAPGVYMARLRRGDGASTVLRFVRP